jgi:hypothetical protein
MRRTRRLFRPHLEHLDDRCLLSSLPPGYSPTQVKSAYGLNALNFTSAGGQTVSADGTGEVIAIVVAFHDPNLASDLQTFDSTYGLTTPSLSQVDLAGPTTNDGWAGEETLDVEWAHAIAPGAKIVVVEAASDSTNDLLAAVNTARNTPGVNVVSMSWGGSEFSGQTSNDSYFTTPAGHTGITFIAASGDSGAGAGAEWPASSPNVLSVGGTSLVINSDNSYGGESAWSGSGTGISSFEKEPSYQSSVQSTGRRTVPDVSFLADPNTGIAVYTTNPSDGQGGWQVVGGTSVGTPSWAGIIAIIDQGLGLGGKGSLDGATQTLPDLYALGSSDFHSVANSTVNVRTGRFSVTTISSVGLGTPIGQKLIADLVPVTTTVGSPTALPNAQDVAVINHLYETILQRAPDTAGQANALAYLMNGGTVAQLASSLLHSAEYDAIVVTRDFRTDLGRAPTSQEINAGVAALQTGETERQFSAGLLNSAEFNQAHASQAQFATAVYQATLGRAATSQDITAVEAALNARVSRGAIVNFLLGSTEATLLTIQTIYETLLGRLPDAAGQANALQALQAGTLSPVDLATILASSQEFLAKSS